MRLARWTFVLVAHLIAVSAACAAEPSRQDLWTAGEAGYAIYRIPGLVCTAKGTLIAYCEARKNGSDWGEIDLTVRRSTDGGKTWSPSKLLGERPANAQRNPAAVARKQGKDGAITMNNPVMIAGRDGAVHLLYCIEYGRVFYSRSSDDGQTFGTPTEITAAFEPLRAEYDWKVLATGPGHGIELSTGRLLVPVWLSLGTEGNAHKPSRVTTVYSDDQGKTWKAGAMVPKHVDVADPSETNAVELSDGRVMLNLRHTGAKHFRAVTTSADGSGNWSPFRLDESLPEPICFGTLHRFSGGKGSTAKNIILFANPNNPTDRARKNVTVQSSEDDGKTWTKKLVIEPGFSAYSDLTVGTDGAIYCLVETAGTKKAYGALTIVKFGIDDLK